MADIAASVPAYAAVTYAALEKGFGLQWPWTPPIPTARSRLSVEDLLPPAEIRPGPGRIRRARRFGRIPLPAHGRQGQLFLAPEQHHEEDPYPQAGIQRPAPSVPERVRRDRGRRMPRPSASGTARPSAVVSAAGSMKVAARVTGDVRPGHGLRPVLHRGHGPRLPDAHGAAARTGPGLRHPRTDREGVTMYLLPRKEARKLVAALAEDYELYGPVLRTCPASRCSTRSRTRPTSGWTPPIPYNPPKGAVFPAVRADHVLHLQTGRAGRPTSTGTTSSGPRPSSG